MWFREFVFVLFLQTVVCSAAAWVALRVQRAPLVNKTPLHEWFQVAAACTSATLFSSWALSSVTYPTQLLAKSCKLVPVMLLGWVLHGRRYRRAEYVAVVLITLGVVFYTVSKELNDAKPAPSSITENSLFGLVLLLASLACDGLIGPKQEQLKLRYGPTDLQLMLGTNACGALFLLPMIVYLDSARTVIEFVRVRPAVLGDLGWLCAYSAMGQFFVFLTSALLYLPLSVSSAVSIGIELVSCLLLLSDSRLFAVVALHFSAPASLAQSRNSMHCS